MRKNRKTARIVKGVSGKNRKILEGIKCGFDALYIRKTLKWYLVKMYQFAGF